MTPDEHASKAEKIISRMRLWDFNVAEQCAEALYQVQLAQVHATLSLRPAPAPSARWGPPPTDMPQVTGRSPDEHESIPKSAILPPEDWTGDDDPH